MSKMDRQTYEILNDRINFYWAGSGYVDLKQSYVNELIHINNTLLSIVEYEDIILEFWYQEYREKRDLHIQN